MFSWRVLKGFAPSAANARLAYTLTHQQCARASSSLSSAGNSQPPVYVVWGSTGGIGSALAARLSKHDGATLVLVGRDQGKLQKLQQETGAAATHTADITDARQVDAVMSSIKDKYGRITGVANCVGSIVLKAAHQTSDAEWDQVLKLNLTSCFNLLRPSVKAMTTSGGGSIVFCSSAVAKHGIPNHEAIAAAKAGVVGLALSAAATYAPKNIRVNCVAPGLTRTPLAARITSNPAALKVSESMHALKRVGEADEVASAIEFFLHPSNSFVTGQVLAVAGGLDSLKPQ